MKDIIEKTNPEEIEVEPKWARELREKVDNLEQENRMLKDFAGHNKMENWKDAQKDKTQKFCHFKIYKDKVVVGWSNLDYEIFNPKASSAEAENILTTLYYLDGTKEKVNYMSFINSKGLVKCRVILTRGDIVRVEFPPEIVTKYELKANHLDVESKFLNA